MSMPDDVLDSCQGGSGVSRRGLFRRAAGIGAATVAAGLLVDAMADPASAAEAPVTGQPHQAGEPIVAHVRDVRSGAVDLFVGTRHIQVHDQELAIRLARAAR